MTRDNIIILPVHLPCAEECQRDPPPAKREAFFVLLGGLIGLLTVAVIAYVQGGL